MDFSNKRVLTLAEGCEYLGYAKSYVYKLTSAGVLPHSKPNGKTIYFDKEKLEQWMLSNPKETREIQQVNAATYITTKQTKGGVHV